jgi:peptidoglycan/LPS O-acetylase OafA/YrhL
MARYDRPELDALRFIAFALVLSFHLPDYLPLAAGRPWIADALTMGAFGVPVFFLLSAFLITELLAREREGRGKVNVTTFYGRRVLRIWPLYFAVLLGLTALQRWRPDVGPATLDQFAAFALFYANWHIAMNGWVAGPLDPLWSISVEEQFYLLVPVLMALGGRRAITGLALTALAAAYGTIWLYAVHPTVGDNGQWTNGLVQGQFFAAGCLLSNLLRGRLPGWRWPTRLVLLAAGAAAWLIAIGVCGVKSWDPRSPTPWLAMAGWLLVLGGTVAVFLSALGLDARRAPPALTYAGRISYGLYVFHALVLHLVFHQVLPALDGWRAGFSATLAGRGAGLVAALVLLGLAAHLSYRFFETPFLRLKTRLAVVTR